MAPVYNINGTIIGARAMTSSELITTAGIDLDIGICFLSMVILYIGFVTLALFGLKFSAKRV